MQRALWGVGAVLGIEAVAAFVLLVLIPSSAKTWFYVIGGVAEALGVILIAWPDLKPRLLVIRRLTSGVVIGFFTSIPRVFSEVARRGVAYFRGMSDVGAQVSDTGTSTGHSSQTADEVRVTGEAETRAWLRELANRITALEDDVMRLPSQWSDDIDRARRDVETEIRKGLHDLAEREIELRLLGLLLLLLGLFLSSVGNLI